MNYTPLPAILTSQAPTTNPHTPDPYTPEPPAAHSPYKKALATILIAMFLGIGSTYAYFRNSTSEKTNQQAIPVVTVIPSPLPTVEPLEYTPTNDPNAPETILTCPEGSVQVCESGVCTCGPSAGVSPTLSPREPSITQNPALFSCSAGTVKVCQNEACECVPGNQ
jgi:hypothetical protein